MTRRKTDYSLGNPHCQPQFWRQLVHPSPQRAIARGVTQSEESLIREAVKKPVKDERQINVRPLSILSVSSLRPILYKRIMVIPRKASIMIKKGSPSCTPVWR